MLNNKKKLQKYFKLATYKIFKMIYGEVKSKTSHLDHKDINFKKVKIEDSVYGIFICDHCSFYTDRIHDAAVIKNNQIVDGPSFQLRNNVNVNCLENSIIENGTPRVRKNLKGNILSLLTGGGGNANYWHWLFDVLPRLKIYLSINSNLEKIDYFLFPSLTTSFQKETLDLLNISKKKRLSSKNYRHLISDRIIVTSHPYTLLNDPDIDSLNIPLWLSKFLRDSFLKKCLENSKIKNFSKKIYINRKDGTSLRYIINENDIAKNLNMEGFVSLTMSDYSFSDQVALFYNAEQVVGLHGAGFANIVFCKPETKVIEIRSNTAGDVIKNLAVNNKLNYQDISCVPKTINYNNQLGDIEVDLKVLKKKIQFK